MTDKMTDFDALIDNVVESAKECENEHEHRGFYIDSIEKNHAAARSALREAIAEVVKEADDFKVLRDPTSGEAKEAVMLFMRRHWDMETQVRIGRWLSGDGELAEKNAALEAELKEANEDAGRLAEEYITDDDGKRCFHCGALVAIEYHADNCAYELHIARLSKRGQGKEDEQCQHS